MLHHALRWRWPLIAGYVVAAGLVIWLVGRQLGMEIFPSVDSGQFQLRLRAADGTRIETTEQIANEALSVIKDVAGPDNVAISVGYVGLIASSYPIDTIYLWMRGPEEAVLRVGLKPGCGVSVEALEAAFARGVAATLAGLAGAEAARRGTVGGPGDRSGGRAEVLLRAG